METFKGKKYEIRKTKDDKYFYVVYDRQGDEEYLSYAFSTKDKAIEKVKEYINNFA